ncbi:MAG TPA: protein kinase [Gemmatimonadaceae bacterium]|nr:protein kinase [Gemmatimonadaceae bacterium]
MNPKNTGASSRIRDLFDELIELEPKERAARLARLDRNDPDVARLEHLLDADGDASQRLAGLEFLYAPASVSPAASNFDAVTAFSPNYTIEGELDGGGMSRVFVGRDAKLGRKIVAKVVPPELAADVTLERFQREIKVAAQLRHPHIVPLLESGEAAGCLYYTMPFIEGESLRDRLRRDGPLPPHVALRLAIEIADALAYAHDFGLIHRDIKPGNVLVDSGHAVVADFGIARALSDAGTATTTHSEAVAPARTITHSGVIIGTPAYMSPEQASSDGIVDARTDIYSLGCVLHEMLHGAPVIGGHGTAQSSARESSARVAARVRAIIARATARRPDDRFQTAHAMREALQAAAAPRISPPVMWSTVAAVVVLVVGAGLALRPRTDQSFASPQAVVKQVTTRGDVRLAAISPGGEYFAFVTGDTILRVGEVGTGALGSIRTGLRLGPPRQWRIRQVSWSPDGSILYYLPEPPHDVSAVPKVGAWRGVIANPLLAGPVEEVWSGSRDAPGFAISPVDSSLALWVMLTAHSDRRDGPIVRDPTVILRLPGRGSGQNDTTVVRLDMLWAMISYSPNGRWLAACGGSESRPQSWRLAVIAVDGTTQTILDSAAVAPAMCGVMWSARGDSLHVWPKMPGSGMVTYRIDNATGKALGPPAPFRLPPAPAGERAAFTMSADGRRLAYIQHTARRYVAVAKLGAGIEVGSQDVSVGAQDPSRPEISPTGDRFAYVIADDSGSAIYTQDLRGGEPRRLSRRYREGVSGVRWSDDGTRIATLTRRDSQPVILILDATGAELTTVRMRHTIYDTTVYRPAFDWAARSTSVMYLALDSAKTNLDTWLIDLASGRERRLLSYRDGANSQYESLPVWSPDGKAFLTDSRLRVNMRDAATGAKRDLDAMGVPLVWRADGTFFSERINPDGTTSIWRSSVGQRPTLYAHFGKECRLISMDRQARRAVCQVNRDESDVFVVTRP